MSESIFENICKDDFYFINKHDINWLVIKNHMGEYMYYDVDEIEKTDNFTAYTYDKNRARILGIEKRDERFENEATEKAIQDANRKVREGQDEKRDEGEYKNPDKIGENLGIDEFLAEYDTKEKFGTQLTQRIDNIEKKLIAELNVKHPKIKSIFNTKLGELIKAINVAKGKAATSYDVQAGGAEAKKEGKQKITSTTKNLVNIVRNYVIITDDMGQIILKVLMRKDKIIEKLIEELKQLADKKIKAINEEIIKLKQEAKDAEAPQEAKDAKAQQELGAQQELEQLIKLKEAANAEAKDILQALEELEHKLKEAAEQELREAQGTVKLQEETKVTKQQQLEAAKEQQKLEEAKKEKAVTLDQAKEIHTKAMKELEVGVGAIQSPEQIKEARAAAERNIEEIKSKKEEKIQNIKDAQNAVKEKERDLQMKQAELIKEKEKEKEAEELFNKLKKVTEKRKKVLSIEVDKFMDIIKEKIEDFNSRIDQTGENEESNKLIIKELEEIKNVLDKNKNEVPNASAERLVEILNNKF